MARSIPFKVCMSAHLVDIVIYLKRHLNWLKGFGGVLYEFLLFLLTLALAFTLHTALCVIIIVILSNKCGRKEMFDIVSLIVLFCIRILLISE